MPERAYTVAEIDRMRAAVRWKLLPRTVVNGQVRITGDRSVYHMDGTNEIIPAVSPALVEDHLRTYMLAGVDPSDLEPEKTGEP